METTASSTASRTATDPAQRRRTRALGVAAAVLGAVLVHLVATALLGIEIVVETPQGVMDLGVGPVITVALLMSLLGWGVAVVLERVVPSAARTTWLVLAVGFLVLSFVPVFAQDLDAGGQVTLALEHLVVGLAVIPAIATTFRTR